ncbi:homoserine dehydrogenase [Helicobacter sp. CLO-3]|uniref:homoserine dehydrogenase n=1 Tax=unclassified Helicobacter TaxID=2593540 RepID=UPI000804874E|nr:MULTISPECIES: homoserine dehydrogenase [unclassified Helicobacter]OBV28500.1 homoserine dehydrogenase [Helicobacter sp. CLO-3]OHU84187.1 homoserine dehydrogenase [Helicobacter sp. CLO-3]
MHKQLKVALIGVGVVGSSVAQILEKNREIITARTGVEIIVKKGVVRNISKARNVNIPLTTNADEVLYDNEIDVIVELMGGIDEAYKIATIALNQHKAFVTANKAMLAYHRYELEKLASTPIGFEASVCGGIPIIKALKDGLSANHILELRAILNGTSNYILSKMTQEGREFDEALKSAQALGYAEANPSLDINGKDAAHKLLILASLAYGINALPEEILIEGIEHISADDIAFASEFDFCIKLLGIAKITIEGSIELRIHPTMIPTHKLIAKVDGVMNAVSVIGDCVGESVYYGAGAGGNATASSVISDLIEIARGKASESMLGFETSQERKLAPKELIKSRYYMRILVCDKPGVLEQIAKVLSQNNISVDTFLQRTQENDKVNNSKANSKTSENLDSGVDSSAACADSRVAGANSRVAGATTEATARMFLTTHTTSEQSIQKAINELKTLPIIKQAPIIIRIDDE